MGASKRHRRAKMFLSSEPPDAGKDFQGHRRHPHPTSIPPLGSGTSARQLAPEFARSATAVKRQKNVIFSAVLSGWETSQLAGSCLAATSC